LVPAKDLSGKTFGTWTVLRRSPNIGGYVMWLCVCSCGTERSVRAAGLKSGMSRSCNGCKRFTEKISEYYSWRHMVKRCLDQKDPAYYRYGGRGIKVCKRWAKSFYAFYKDMGPKPLDARTEIDRINNNGDYEPKNCRWATPRQNANNRRSNRFLEFNGQRLTLMQWSRATGIKRSTIQMRLDAYGWPLEKALTKP
jgi:hypothetical protein